MEVKCFIHAKWNRYKGDNGEFEYSIHSCDMTDYGYVLLEEVQVPFESPSDKQLRTLAAKALRAQKNRRLAEVQKECLDLQQEIDELLAIEYKA